MNTILENARKMISGDVPPPPVGVLVGFRLVEIERGRSLFAMEATARHANPMGTLHGGILCDIADAAMGMAYASTLEEGESFTTLELKINFLRPVKQARLTAEGVVVSRGKTVGLAECTVMDENGRLIAKASSTCITLRGEQARDR
jgi:uncharacterized protein (TIGR00369 family)